MNKSKLKWHCCPNCRSTNLTLTRLTDPNSEVISDGSIECPQCQTVFQIKGELPRFVPESNYADSFGYQWNIHAKTQLDSYSSLPISHDRLWAALGGKKDLTGQMILEAGSGSGRFTEVLAQSGATIVSFDYSKAAEANLRNQKEKNFQNVHLFQGDIFNIPLQKGSFDKVICLGVIQHTPDPEKAFKSLAQFVKPGGQLIVDAYADTIVARLHWKYLLRPLLMRVKKETLYHWIQKITPPLVPVAKFLRQIFGRWGARLVPIVEYSYLGLTPELNIQWAILDTFDMYSPAHDHPQSVKAIRQFFIDEGFTDIEVSRGLNGVVGRGIKKSLTELHQSLNPS